MKFKIFSVIFWISAILQTGCVTIKVGNSELTRADHVEMNEPAQPFRAVKTTHADRAWQSDATGSSISFTTSCGETTDPTLEALRASLIQGVADQNIQEQKVLSYNGREALDSTVAGQVDGVPVLMKILVFKKNNCHYHLSLVAMRSHFKSDLPHFEGFLKGFKAQ